MKKAAIIFGLGVITGVAAIAILSTVRKEQDAESKKEDTTPMEAPVSDVENTSVEDYDCDNSSVSSMSERHKEAAKIVKDAITVICENSGVSSDTDSKLENISSELDDLLGEA